MDSSIIFFNTSASVVSAKNSISLFNRAISLISGYTEVHITLRGRGYTKINTISRQFVKGPSAKLILRGKSIEVKYFLEKLLTSYHVGSKYNRSNDDPEIVLSKLCNELDYMKNEKPNFEELNDYYKKNNNVFQDLLRSKNSFFLEVTGSDHEVDRRHFLYEKGRFYFFRRKESGSKFVVKVIGKPVIALSVFNLIKTNSKFFNNFLQ